MTKKVTMIFGWVFLVIGILGFFNNPILGIFAVDTAHNLVHLLSGAIFLWVAYSAPMKAMGLLKVFGIVYLLVAILGFMSSSGMILGLITTNAADNWLHVVLALVFIWAGFMGGKSMSSVPMGPQM